MLVVFSSGEVYNVFISSCELNFLVVCCAFTSMLFPALRAFTYLCAFDLFTLLTYMVSLWLTSQQENRIRDSIHTFSQERVEILFVFSSVVVAILGAIFVIKESFLRYVFAKNNQRSTQQLFFSVLYELGFDSMCFVLKLSLSLTGIQV